MGELLSALMPLADRLESEMAQRIGDVEIDAPVAILIILKVNSFLMTIILIKNLYK